MKRTKRNPMMKFYVAVVTAVIIAGVGFGFKTMKEVQAFNEYEAKLAEYELYYTNVMVEYNQLPQEIFREICNQYPDTCNYKVTDWMFCVEYMNDIDLDTVRPGCYLIVPYLNGPTVEK